MRTSTVPVEVEYLIEDLVNRGYVVVYNNTEVRNIYIVGVQYRVEISLYDHKDYGVSYFVNQPPKIGAKGENTLPIMIDTKELELLKCLLNNDVESLVRWAYEGDSFAYTYSNTKQKVVRVG